MTGQKKYSAGQFMLMLPERFAFLFLFKLLQVWGYEPVTCNHADGRKVLNTTSMFLLENTIASSHNQLSGKCVARMFAYLEPQMRIGKGFGKSQEESALISKDPYKMDKQECISHMEKNSLFGDDEEYFKNEAPLYELQFMIFDWAARSEELFGVRYIYGVDQDTPTKSVCEVMFVKDQQNYEHGKGYCVNSTRKIWSAFFSGRGEACPKNQFVQALENISKDVWLALPMYMHIYLLSTHKYTYSQRNNQV